MLSLHYIFYIFTLAIKMQHIIRVVYCLLHQTIEWLQFVFFLLIIQEDNNWCASNKLNNFYLILISFDRDCINGSDTLDKCLWTDSYNECTMLSGRFAIETDSFWSLFRTAVNKHCYLKTVHSVVVQQTT